MRINSFTPNINFCAYKSKFSEHLEQVLEHADKSSANKLSQEFKDVFKHHYSDSYYMGRGWFNEVYKLDDFYIMRIPSKADKDKTDFSGVKKEPLVDKLKTYYASPIAKFGDISIQKNAIGDESFIVMGTFGDSKKFEDELKYYKKVYLPVVANISQESFDALAHDMKLLNDNGLAFDSFNQNNFICVGDEIRVVDDLKSEKSSIYDMLYVFTRTLFYKESLDEADFLNLQTILKKCLIAAQKEGLDFDIETNNDKSLYLFQKADLTTNLSEIYYVIKHLKNDETINSVLNDLFSNRRCPNVDK